MDFDLMIKELMHKYSIDINHPWFYESVQAEKLIKCFWEKVKYKKVVLLFEKEGDYENFRIHIPEEVSYKGIQYQNNSFFSYKNSVEELEKTDADALLLITYRDHVRIGSELVSCGLELVDIYDYLVENGLLLFHEFYQITNELYFDSEGEKIEDSYFQSDYGVLFYDKRRYKLAKTEILKKYYLENVIFDYYNMRNFDDGALYIEKYCELYPEDAERYYFFLREAETLLDKMQRIITSKKQKDIVMYWLDAFSYGEDKNLPYLHSLDNECMVCSNAFAVIDTTGGEASALFCQEAPMESKRFRQGVPIEESNIFDILEKHGWEFKYYGIDRILDGKLVNIRKHRLFAVSTLHYWKMLCDMVVDTVPTFRLVHLMGGHTPYLSADMDGEKYFPIHERANLLIDQDIYAQRKNALQYEDRQMAFYDKRIDTKATIYFSDHGCHSFALSNIAVLHHIMFKIKSELVRKGVNSQMFSPLYFEKLVKYLLEPQKYQLQDMMHDYVKVYGLPRYSKSYNGLIN
ncbi:MAG: hypothetical protein ACI4EC_08990 [Lachnospiraceae bacterium]